MTAIFAYHITPRKNLVSIQEKGLLPSEETFGLRRKGIAVYESLKIAETIIRGRAGIRWAGGSIVILAVDVSGMEAIPLKRWGFFVVAPDGIAPESIHVRQHMCNLRAFKAGAQDTDEFTSSSELLE